MTKVYYNNDRIHNSAGSDWNSFFGCGGSQAVNAGNVTFLCEQHSKNVVSPPPTGRSPLKCSAEHPVHTMFILPVLYSWGSLSLKLYAAADGDGTGAL